MLFPVLFLLIFSTFAPQTAFAESRNLEINQIGINVSGPQTYGIKVDEPISISYRLAWTSTTVNPNPVFAVDRLNVNTAVANPSLDPTIRSLYLGVNFPGAKLDCLGGQSSLSWTDLTSQNCELGIINDGSVQNITTMPSGEQKVALDYSQIKDKVTTPPTKDNPVTVSLVLFPVVDLDYYDAAQAIFAACKVSGTISGLDGVFSYLTGVNCNSLLNTDKAYSNHPVTINIKVYSADDTVPADEVAGTGTVSGDGTGTTNPSDTTNPYAAPIDFLAKIFGTLILWSIEIFYTLFSILVIPIIVAVLSINTYTDIFASVILPGWEVLRNLSNIFFILVLLFVALGTIFRIEAFKIGVRQVVLRLVIAALLVNFSLVIGQSVLGIAETVQNQFLGQDAGGVREIAYNLAIAPFTQTTLSPDPGVFVSPGTYQVTPSSTVGVSLSKLIFPLFYLGMAAATFIVLGGLAIMLLIRMVMVWILLMSSPMAYVAMVLPQTARYTREWWSTLIKYAFFPAIIAFFLNITAYVLQTSKPIMAKFSEGNNQLGAVAGFIFPVMTQVSALIFIVLGIGVAQKLGIIGGKTLSNWGTKGLKLPLTLSKGAASFAGNRITERFPILSPTFLKEGIQNYRKKRSDEWREKANESARKGLLGIPARVGINNPEQLFENLGTFKGLKKLTPKALAQQLAYGQAEKKAKAKSEIMTDDERARKEASKNQAKSKETDLRDRANTIDQAADIRVGDPAFNEVKSALNARKNTLLAQLDILQKEKLKADKDGNSQKSTELQRDIQEIADQVKEYDDKSVIGDNLVRIGQLENADPQVRQYLKKALQDQSKSVGEEAKKLEEETTADDELRKKNNFSVWDGKTKGDPTRAADYREFTEENKRYLQQKSAEFGKEKSDRQFTPIWNERKEFQAKVRDAQKSFEEQEYTSDDHIQGFQKEYAKGEGGDKYKMQAHLIALARDDSLPGLLKSMGKNFSHEDYIELLRSMRSMSEKETLQLTASLDKINKGVKQLSLTNSVERVGGALQFRSEERHNYERMKALEGMTLGEVVKLPKTALADVTRGVDGTDLYSVHDEVYQALEEGAKTKNADKFFRERIPNSKAKVFLASDKVQAWSNPSSQYHNLYQILEEKANRVKP